jgi:hypothetical protein
MIILHHIKTFPLTSWLKTYIISYKQLNTGICLAALLKTKAHSTKTSYYITSKARENDFGA